MTGRAAVRGDYSTTRPGVDQKIDNEARKALAEMNRWDRKAEEARTRADAARADLAVMHRKTCERFGRDLPTDALLLDVLQLVDIEEGDVWRWRGMRNNFGLPTIKFARPGSRATNERSLVRYLAIELGVIKEDTWGVLYPENGDKDDVNPYHRTLRAADQPVGNSGRYGFTLTEEATP